MGVTREMTAAAALHRRRSLKSYTLRRADILAATWLSLALFIRFLVNAAFAARTLASGRLSAGYAITRFCLFTMFLDVFLLSFLFSTLQAGSFSLDRRRVGLSPAPFSAYFLCRLSSMGMNPVSWTVVPLLVPACIPLAFMPHPGAGIGVLAVGFIGVFAGAWTLGAAVSLLPGASKAEGLFRVVFPAAMLALVLANFSFQIDGDVIRLMVFQRTIRFGVGDTFGGPGTPWAWVMDASLGDAPIRALLVSSTGATGAFALYALLLRAALRRVTGIRRPRAARRSVVRPGARSLWSLLFFKEISEGFLSSRAVISRPRVSASPCGSSPGGSPRPSSPSLGPLQSFHWLSPWRRIPSERTAPR